MMLLGALAPAEMPAQAARQYHPLRTVSGQTMRNSVELLQPYHLVARSNGVIVYDGGSHSVIALGPDGAKLWEQGRKGGGPGEYGNVIGMQLGAGGILALHDEGNGRVTFLDSTGTYLSTMSVPTNMSKLLAVMAVDHVQILPHRAWEVVEVRNGRVTKKPMWVTQPSTESLLNETVVAARDEHGGTVIGFRWFRDIVMQRQGRILRLTIAAEKTASPQVVTRKVPGTKLTVTRVNPGGRQFARSVTTNGACVLALVYAEPDDRPRTIDVWSATSGSYLGSLQLPGAAMEIAVYRNRLAVLTNNPIPAVNLYDVEFPECR